MTTVVAQLSGCSSLRDIVENMAAQHQGSVKLSSINEDKPYSFTKRFLVVYCQAVASSHPFRFDNPLYSLDATTIDVGLLTFP